ncbi:MAG: flagellar biosynthetic protein FliO [Chloroflexi bacterium]|nr:flagellar biosynthetic protein FliO [Chloroflexota bacterium]
MNAAANRKRLIWMAALGGGLLLVLLVASLAAPSGSSAPVTPVIRTDAAAGLPGATTAAPTGTNPEADPGFSLGGAQAVSLAWRLGLVVIIIAASIAGLRWWARRASAPRSTSGFLKVVDTLAIGSGRTVHLVALGERVIVVGATAQNLSLLGELSEDEAGTVHVARPASAPQSLSGFASDLFESIRRERRAPTARVEAVIGGGDYS